MWKRAATGFSLVSGFLLDGRGVRAWVVAASEVSVDLSRRDAPG